MGVTHELVGKEEPLKNGHVPEAEPDSEEAHLFSEPLCPVHSIILDFGPVNFIDSVGAKAIKSVIKEYAEIKVQVYLAGCSRTLLKELKTLNFFGGGVTLAHIFPSVHDAVLFCQHRIAHQRDSLTANGNEPSSNHRPPSGRQEDTEAGEVEK